MNTVTLTCKVLANEPPVTVTAETRDKLPGWAVGLNPKRVKGRASLLADKYALLHVASSTIATTAKTKQECWRRAELLRPLGDWVLPKDSLPREQMSKAAKILLGIILNKH